MDIQPEVAAYCRDIAKRYPQVSELLAERRPPTPPWAESRIEIMQGTPDYSRRPIWIAGGVGASLVASVGMSSVAEASSFIAPRPSDKLIAATSQDFTFGSSVAARESPPVMISNAEPTADTTQTGLVFGVARPLDYSVLQPTVLFNGSSSAGSSTETTPGILPRQVDPEQSIFQNQTSALARTQEKASVIRPDSKLTQPRQALSSRVSPDKSPAAATPAVISRPKSPGVARRLEATPTPIDIQPASYTMPASPAVTPDLASKSPDVFSFGSAPLDMFSDPDVSGAPSTGVPAPAKIEDTFTFTPPSSSDAIISLPNFTPSAPSVPELQISTPAARPRPAARPVPQQSSSPAVSGSQWEKRGREAIVKWADSQVGISETGKIQNDGPPSWLYSDGATGKRAPWCAWFVSTGAKKTGRPFKGIGVNSHGKIPGTVSMLNNMRKDPQAEVYTAEQIRRHVYTPKPGDILEFKHPYGDAGIVNHVSLLKSFDSRTGKDVRIGGNERNSVKLTHNNLYTDSELRFVGNRFAHPPQTKKRAAAPRKASPPAPAALAPQPSQSPQPPSPDTSGSTIASAPTQPGASAESGVQFGAANLATFAQPTTPSTPDTSASPTDSVIIAAPPQSEVPPTSTTTPDAVAIGQSSPDTFSQSTGADPSFIVQNPGQSAEPGSVAPGGSGDGFVPGAQQPSDPPNQTQSPSNRQQPSRSHKPMPASPQPSQAPQVASGHLTPEMVSRMVPSASSQALRYVPLIENALQAEGIDTLPMELYTFATIRVETSSMEPIPEIGRGANSNIKGGAQFYGRGFVQLTHGYNYKAAGDAINEDLYHHPDLALKPEIAAKVLAWYMQAGEHDTRILDALKSGDMGAARAVVNGGTNGLKKFTKSYNIGKALVDKIYNKSGNLQA